jgi:hypothetical protein
MVAINSAGSSAVSNSLIYSTTIDQEAISNLVAWYKFISSDVSGTNLLYNYATSIYDASLVNLSSSFMNGSLNLSRGWANATTNNNSGYVKVNKNISLGSVFSISFWMKLNTYPAAANQNNVGYFSFLDNSGNIVLMATSDFNDGMGYMLLFNSSSNFGGSRMARSAADSGSILTNSSYLHFCLVCNGTGANSGKVYSNNSTINNFTNTATLNISSFNIGYSIATSSYYGGQSPYFNGNIYDFRLYNVALTSTQVSAIYNNSLSITKP